MTSPKPKRDYRHEAEIRYLKKPKPVNLKIVRTCLALGCGFNFVAETKTLRLCPECRKKDWA